MKKPWVRDMFTVPQTCPTTITKIKGIPVSMPSPNSKGKGKT